MPQILPYNLLKGETVHFLSILWITFFWYVKIECIELNWFYKNVRKSQASTSTNFCTELGYRSTPMWETISDNWKPFKIDEKFFLYHLKIFFPSWDVYIFILTFWLFRKNGLIRKLCLISKIYDTTTGQQLVALHILCNISISKSN